MILNMNKYTFIIAMLAMSTQIKAQDVWERPDDEENTEQTVSNSNDRLSLSMGNRDSKYLAGAVPEVDGKVAWTFKYDVPGSTAQQIYDVVLNRMKAFTRQDNQLEGSSVALVNKKEHSIVVTAAEWMTFKDAFLSLDRAKFYYVLVFHISDNHFEVSMERIYYRYNENDGKGEYKLTAEKCINDANALNRKKTKLVPGWAKFRRKTIDRVDEINKYMTKIVRQIKSQNEKK